VDDFEVSKSLVMSNAGAPAGHSNDPWCVMGLLGSTGRSGVVATVMDCESKEQNRILTMRSNQFEFPWTTT
jgi:hypothetical protein